jgi:hypothetical protein
MIHLTIVTGSGLHGTCTRRLVPARDAARIADLWVGQGCAVLRGWYFSDVEKAAR